MKTFYLIVFLIFLIISNTQAQVGPRQLKKKQTASMDTVSQSAMVENTGKIKRKKVPNSNSTQVSNTKLDDLKNPFDTTKLTNNTVKSGTISTEQNNSLNKTRKKKDNVVENNKSNTFATKTKESMTGAVLENEKAELRADLKTISKSYKGKNGNVDVTFEKSKKPKDGVKTKTQELKESMCLTKEEVRGQKIENEIIIADGSKAVQILPGAVIDASVLLNSGEFKFLNMTKRKPISLTTTSNLAIKVSQTANSKKDNDITDELRTKVHQLTNPSNIRGMPNMSSTSEASISTLEETTGLNIGASFFYMGMKASNNFAFSSKKYRYMYMYTFEQVCLPVIANSITSPDDLFTETTPLNNNWLYIQEVSYGRRLYVLMESEYDLEKYSNELQGKVSWGVVSAKLSATTKGSSFSSNVNIRVYTQGGQPLAITDKSQVQKEIENYFKSSFKQMDIVPLSYKLTYMDGDLVSLVSNAYLDGKNCLDADKVKIRIKSIECKKVDDSKKNEEIYGSAILKVYNDKNQVILTNGMVAPPLTSTGAIKFGSKEVPINFTEGKSKVYQETEQGKYIDLHSFNLDSKFEIIPQVFEKDNGFNSDDQYTTENRLNKTLRQMLMEGTTSQTFEFRRKGSLLLVTFEIIPY